MNHTLNRVNGLSHALMLLTSVHHIYGAIIYNTPWRYHAVYVAIATILITAVLSNQIKQKALYRRSILFWFYWGIVFLISVLSIGVFEGIYNHFLKDLLYVTRVHPDILLSMFPPPVYEMPNDLIFEVTGVMQAFLAVVLIIALARMTRSVLKEAIPQDTSE